MKYFFCTSNKINVHNKDSTCEISVTGDVKENGGILLLFLNMGAVPSSSHQVQNGKLQSHYFYWAQTQSRGKVLWAFKYLQFGYVPPRAGLISKCNIADIARGKLFRYSFFKQPHNNVYSYLDVINLLASPFVPYCPLFTNSWNEGLVNCWSLIPFGYR